ncbi:MAG TPA: C69 family dipeptidase [Bacteroidales bacterium]|nr:C69 family dipeptidase [Bacteroidales bacterium]
MKKTIILILGLMVGMQYAALACTNFLITKGASTDGSTMISYAADSHVLYGELYYFPAADYKAGDMLKVYEWDSGKYLGEIPQISHTYQVVGNVNEHQVAIGETTYGGRPELVDTTAILDYGSLIYIALQRSKTAREAIKVITDLIALYGYYSSGESFSIADKNEVWIFEMIGKGPGNKGAVWVARLVPDGYVCAHANQARITTFEYQKKNKWDDPNANTFNSPDVISFARSKKYFSGKDEEFSFSDTYAPVDFSAARFCEIRVWAFFNSVTDGMDKYWDYAKGHIEHGANGYATNRMPLWVKPTKKIGVLDVMAYMRDHLENTELDMSKDAGAGPFGCPYRWRPLTWQVDGQTYLNERATATQQTGFSFVAQMRSWLPDKVGCINWFSVDDAACTVYMPIYCGIAKVPYPIAHGNGSMMEFSDESAFWVFNQVSNFAYTRWNSIYPEIKGLQYDLEKGFTKETAVIDSKIANMKSISDAEITDIVTQYSVTAVEMTFKTWKKLYSDLFVKYMDGNIKEKNPVPDNYLYVTPSVKQPGYSYSFLKNIVDETKDKLKVVGPAH